jgi:hypothetical protein
VSEKEDCPKNVLEQVCDARMKALEAKFRYLYVGSIITIALIIVQLARGG